jgi:hypothetical protein
MHKYLEILSRPVPKMALNDHEIENSSQLCLEASAAENDESWKLTGEIQFEYHPGVVAEGVIRRRPTISGFQTCHSGRRASERFVALAHLIIDLGFYLPA